MDNMEKCDTQFNSNRYISRIWIYNIFQIVYNTFP